MVTLGRYSINMCWFIKIHFSPNLPQDSPLLMNHTLVPRISTYDSFQLPSPYASSSDSCWSPYPPDAPTAPCLHPDTLHSLQMTTSPSPHHYLLKTLCIHEPWSAAVSPCSLSICSIVHHAGKISGVNLGMFRWAATEKESSLILKWNCVYKWVCYRIYCPKRPLYCILNDLMWLTCSFLRTHLSHRELESSKRIVLCSNAVSVHTSQRPWDTPCQWLSADESRPTNMYVYKCFLHICHIS